MSVRMSPARISWSARKGSSPAASSAGLMYSAYTRLKSMRVPSDPGLAPKGMTTNAWGLIAISGLLLIAVETTWAT